jgi:serine/threonine-protein kinase
VGSATQRHIGPGEGSIRAALEKISASQRFASSERLCRFLRFAVEEALAGNTDKLKETVVGAEVFGRKVDYDPRLDAVVRIEAVKLRARLKEYYGNEGRDDAVRIEMPKGGYVPSFTSVQVDMPEAAVPRKQSRRMWIPVVAGLVLAAGGWWLMERRQPAASRETPSIAVLPFVDLSEAKDQEYFCDGMTEEIIDALARVRGFHVAARSSAFAFKNKQQDIREIGRKLNVSAVLEGSVRKAGKRLRITAQLNNVADGYHLWSETYERELKDVFAVQDEISRAIVGTLRVQLGESGKTSLVTASTGNLEAYNLYLRARYLHSKWQTEPMRRSMELFEQAIAQDPAFAPAYAGLASSETWLGFFRDRPRDVMQKAREAAERALALDDQLAAAHISLGDVKAVYDWDWEGARREYERALQIGTDDSRGHFSHAVLYLTPQGRMKEAIAEMQRAADLDPLHIVVNTYLGALLYFDGQYEPALKQLRKTLEIAPDFAEAHGYMFKIYLDEDRFNEARAALDRCRAITGQTAPGLQDTLLAAAEGRTDSARRMLAEFERLSQNGYFSPVMLACAHAAIGDREAAFRELERALKERDGALAYLKTFGPFNSLREDARFAQLLRAIGLPN